jgi:hypothetical protein
MIPESKKWLTYEEVARYLLNQIADKFGVSHVEGKQKVVGKRSGTEWEIDAKGVNLSDGIFFIVECRRYTTSKQCQDKMGGLAYRILDTGAAGGILVSPLGLQEGAEKVAAAENIHNVTLDKNSTTENYILKFLNEIRIGRSDHMTLIDSIAIKLFDSNEKVIHQYDSDKQKRKP